MRKRFGLVALLTWMPFWGVVAQGELPEFLGFSGGLSVTFGTHVNRMGLNIQGYYRRDFVQVNLQTGGYYQFRELGPRPSMPGWECQLGVGGLIGFGPGSERWHQAFLHVISNQTQRPYALAYGFLWYLDQRNTTQFSGSLAAHIQGLQLVMENDVLMGGIEDKYRTGAFRVAYQRDSLLIGTKVILWTGNTRSKTVKRVRPIETDYP
ncbi:MAG: polymorphic toxin type 23 domain-containing protein, partial [Bacteroidota bacterium]